MAAPAPAADMSIRLDQTWNERAGDALTLTDLLRVTDIGGVAASPDGRHVAFLTRTAGLECDCYRQTLYLWDRTTGGRTPIADLGSPFRALMPNGSINGGLITAQPAWSVDGVYLAFIVNRDDKAHLHVMDSIRKEVREVDTRGEEPLAFYWPQTPGRLVYETGQPDPAAAADFARSNEEGFLYGPQFRGVTPGRLPAPPRVPIHLVWNESLFGPGSALSSLKAVSMIDGNVFLATAEEVKAFSSNRPSSAYQSLLQKDVFSITTPGGGFRLTLGSSAAGPARPVTIENLRDPKRSGREVARSCEAMVSDAYWDETSKRFVLVCSPDSVWGDATAQFIRLDPLTGKHDRWFQLPAPGRSGVMGRTCDIAQGYMVCVEEYPSMPPRLVQFDAAGKAQTVFDPNTVLRSRQFQRVDRWVWTNEFGADTWGNLVYPSGYTAGARYPLVIVQYNASGFLRGGTGNEYPIFPMANAGFFVLNIKHPRPPKAPALSDAERAALAWRGDRWRKSVQSSLDLAIAHLVAQRLVDETKVAYTGLSGGSNQLDYALANGRTIAAAITSTCCIGPENWPAMAANLMYGPVVATTGWANPAVDPNYEASWSSVSPSLHMDTLRTPILANAAESEMLGATALWAKMRARNLPMELYIYPDEYHIKTKPKHRASIYRRNIEWLRFWLQDYEDPASTTPAQYGRWREMREAWGNTTRAQEAKRLEGEAR